MKTGLMIGGIVFLTLGVLTAALTQEILSAFLYLVISIVCFCFFALLLKKAGKLKIQRKEVKTNEADC